MTDRQQHTVAWWTDSENARALYIVDPDGGHGFGSVCDVIGVELSTLNATMPALLDTRRRAISFPVSDQMPDKPISAEVAEAIRAYYEEEFCTKLADR